MNNQEKLEIIQNGTLEIIETEELLKVFDKEKVTLLLNGEISPIIVKEIENEELTELILPMKTY